MDLIVDIGNTIAKLAAFDGDRLVEVIYTSNKTLSDIYDFHSKYSFRKGIVSTVVDVTDAVVYALKELQIEILWVGVDLRLPVRIGYSTPKTLGSDRLAAVVGAYAKFPNRNILVIDAGTCITYDLVTSDGLFLGGNISPGIDMRFKALNMFTSRLPLVSAEGERPYVGHNTETAIRMGVISGVEYEMIGYINDMNGKYPDLLVFLTGGSDFSFEKKLKNEIFADKFLVLKGLNRLLKYNESV